MNRRLFATLSALTLASVIPNTAHATITDSLTGPDTGMIQSALTMPTPATQVLNLTTGPQLWAWQEKYFGNSRFGAGYSVQSENGAFQPGSSEASNYLAARATAFGDTRQVITVNVYGLTNGPNGTATAGAAVYVLGNQVRSVTHSGGDFAGTYNLVSYNQQVYSSGTQTFWIGPIPVSVGASVNANAGESVSGHVWVDGIDGSFGHYVGLTASGFGGIGPSWANAGIRVNNLSLMTATLGLAAKGRYSFVTPPHACVSIFNYGGNYGLALRELSGSLSIYASAFGFSDDYQIASWPGFSQNFTIANFPPTARQLGNCFPIPASPQIGSNIVG